jgi:cytochrome c5
MTMFSKIIAIAASLACVPAAVYAQGRGGAAGPELPPGEGRELVQAVCSGCHDTRALLMKRDGEQGWRTNVERMVVQKGAQIFPGEMETMIRYLVTNLGPGTGVMESGPLPPGALGGGVKTGKDVKLPDAPGREVVQVRCTVCHDLGRVVTTRRTVQDWDSIVHNMMERGPKPAPGQLETVVSYLSSQFGKDANMVPPVK